MEGGEAAEGVMKRKLSRQRVTRVTKEADGVVLFSFLCLSLRKSCSWPTPPHGEDRGKIGVRCPSAAA